MNLPNGRLHAEEVMMKLITGVELTAARQHGGTGLLHPANGKRGEGEEASKKTRGETSRSHGLRTRLEPAENQRHHQFKPRTFSLFHKQNQNIKGHKVTDPANRNLLLLLGHSPWCVAPPLAHWLLTHGSSSPTPQRPWPLPGPWLLLILIHGSSPWSPAPPQGPWLLLLVLGPSSCCTWPLLRASVPSLFSVAPPPGRGCDRWSLTGCFFVRPAGFSQSRFSK